MVLSYIDQNRNYRKLEAENDLEVTLLEYLALSKSHGVPLTEIISLANVMEQKRKNDLFVDHGNILDLQMAGLGQTLDGIMSKINHLNLEQITLKVQNN